jgi:flagellin
MPLIVNTNVSSLISQRNLGNNTMNVQRSMERLSSGFRINHAGDDAAGLTISESLIGQIRGTQQAVRNANDGVSILQIAEGALTVIGDTLQRVRELTIQAANDTNSTTQRNAIEQEIQTRLNDLDRIAQATAFNGINLLDGSAAGALLQIGANSTLATNTLDITTALADAQTAAIGIVGGAATFANVAAINITSSAVARNFLDDVDTAIGAVTAQRSTIGALQNQLESVDQNLQLAVENFSSSNSRIRDLDMAEESANFTQSQILQQASVSILSQANQFPKLTLQLLQQG